MSTGLIFGVKLPTGDWKYSGFDRDVAIGSGSTDAIIGGYHQDKFGKTCPGRLVSLRRWYQTPIATQGRYRPGRRNRRGGAGVYWEGWSFGNGMLLSPIAQAIGVVARP